MYFKNIQAIRAFAALSVVVFHLPLNGKVGSYGVDIFFVISGFLMPFIAQDYPHHVFLRRIIRIVPLYWPATVGIFLVSLWYPTMLQSTTANSASLVKSLLFIPYVRESGLIQPLLFLGWTINYEMYFYAVFALSLMLSRKYCNYVTAAIIALPWLVSLFVELESTIFTFYSQSIILEFVFGIFLYYVWAWKKRKCVTISLPLVNLIILISALSLPCLQYFGEAIQVRSVVFGIPSVLLVLACICAEGKIKVPGLLVGLGNASYSLFIVHPYVIQGCDKMLYKAANFGMLRIIWYLIVIAVCIVLSYIIYSLYERPFIDVLRSQLVNKGKLAGRSV